MKGCPIVQRHMSIDTEAVIDWIHCIEKKKNEFYLKQTKKKNVISGRILQISIIWSRKLIECSVNGFYSLIIINYGTTYNLSFWYHTTSETTLYNSDQVYALFCKKQ